MAKIITETKTYATYMFGWKRKFHIKLHKKYQIPYILYLKHLTDEGKTLEDVLKGLYSLWDRRYEKGEWGVYDYKDMTREFKITEV